MNQLRDLFRRYRTPVEPLTPGTYGYQAPPEVSPHYRLHLRVEPEGSGLLIVNASTILHLNQTATEYAYHLIRETPIDEAAKVIADRYQVKREQAKQDFNDLKERIYSLILMPDLDPISFLDFDRSEPYSEQFSAPLRLDCALTYRTITKSDERVAPTDRVVRELSTDEWKIVLDKAWQAGIPHLVFTGGEPTLRDDLPELLMHAETHGQVTGLLSDGLRLVDEVYLNQLLDSGLDHLMLILNPRVEGTWDGLQKVLAEDLFTTVHITLTPEKVQRLDAVLDRLKEMGVTSISLSASQADLVEALQTARDKIAEREMSLKWDLPVPYSEVNPVDLEVDHFPEGAGNAWLYVEPDGDVLPSQGVMEVLGNLVRDSWEDVWGRAREERMKDEG
jgi:organic radical activating enzyme